MIIRHTHHKKRRWIPILPILLVPCIYFLILNGRLKQSPKLHETPPINATERETTALDSPVKVPTLPFPQQDARPPATDDGFLPIAQEAPTTGSSEIPAWEGPGAPDGQEEPTVESFKIPGTEAAIPPIVDRRSKEKLPCGQYLLYDKPPKTGSSAISTNLRELYGRLKVPYASCRTSKQCGKLANEICAGRVPPQNLIAHIDATPALRTCLREKYNYYIVTSIRDPVSRWDSAFLFNRGKKACHFRICYTESYTTFMNRIPACNHFEYFDQIRSCDDADIEDRIAAILPEYDEIIDLYDRPLTKQGHIARVIAPGLTFQNKSPRPEGEFREVFDTTRLAKEIKLYERLQRRRVELLARSSYRTYCVFDNLDPVNAVD